jgi:hypothetical protein
MSLWSKCISTIALLAPTAKQSELLGILSGLAAEQVQQIPIIQSLILKNRRRQRNISLLPPYVVDLT